MSKPTERKFRLRRDMAFLVAPIDAGTYNRDEPFELRVAVTEVLPIAAGTTGVIVETDQIADEAVHHVILDDVALHAIEPLKVFARDVEEVEG